MNEEFNKWIYDVVSMYKERSRTKLSEEEIYTYIDLTDAKLSFIDGLSPYQYANEYLIIG